MISRREFLTRLGAGSFVALAPVSSRAATLPRVVVVGGGMAGAAAAKYLRLWSGKAIDVTLVEKESRYTSNIMSNLVVTGQRSLSSLYFGYSNLVNNYGIKLVRGQVTAVTPGSVSGTWKVTLANTTTPLECDRVVLAPGIEFDAIPDLNDPRKSAPILHAWHAGPQTDLLRQKLAAMPAGGTFVMTIPPKPYRCPPGPYERACVVADYLKRNKPGSKVIVLDANPGITAEPESFGNAFENMYGDILEYQTDTMIEAVDAVSGTVKTSWNELVHADVLNVIPPHRAGGIVQAVGLANATTVPFAAVDVRSFESTQLGGIHVLGDSSNTTLPKAGHVGNQGAKICAAAIINAFNFKASEPYPTANSACYSPISSTLASWLTVVYRYDAATGKMVASNGTLSSVGSATEASKPSTENFSKMNTWFKTLMAETFS